MSQFKPMLAATMENPETLAYPVLASPKLDGIRCVIKDGVALSRTLKPIRNKTVQAWVQQHAAALEGMDGELVCYPHDETVFNRTTRCVMSGDGDDSWTFVIFDSTSNPERPYHLRLMDINLRLMDIIEALGKIPDHVEVAFAWTVNNADELVDLDSRFRECGYEGTMIRDGDAPYKHGRSTLKQGYLLKFKQWKDDEAEVIGIEQLYKNENELTENELGQAERSHARDGMVAMPMMGSLYVRDRQGREFHIGTGFDHAQREYMWLNTEDIIGKWAKFKHFEAGAKDLPRFPVFLGFRDAEDMNDS